MHGSVMDERDIGWEWMPGKKAEWEQADHWGKKKKEKSETKNGECFQLK